MWIFVTSIVVMFGFRGKMISRLSVIYGLWVHPSLQSRRNFGERMLIILLTKITAAIFDFNGSGRLGREQNFYQGGGRRSIIRRGVGVGG